MLLLIFNIKNSRYALDSSDIVEVIPNITLRKIPKAPKYVAGIFRYRGAVIPVIDMCILLTKKPCCENFGTRIIIINYDSGEGRNHQLGLIAEKVTGTRKVEADELIPCGINVDAAPYLDEIVAEGDRNSREKINEDKMIQTIIVKELLPESLKKSLFALKEEIL